MTVIIDETWLSDHGVEGSKQELKELSVYVNDEWELRVGTVLAEKLTDAQIADFEQLSEDEQGNWLEKIYPDYTEVVQEQAETLEEEIKDNANKVALIKSWKYN